MAPDEGQKGKASTFLELVTKDFKRLLGVGKLALNNKSGRLPHRSRNDDGHLPGLQAGLASIEVPAEHIWWRDHYDAVAANMDRFTAMNLVKTDDYVGKSIMDFGGSAGQLAVYLLENGAAEGVVLDLELPEHFYTSFLKGISGLGYSARSVEEYSVEHRGKFDLIVAHTVSEHVQNLPSALAAIRDCLKPGGIFFIVHDNYYHPSGAHDNFILQPNQHGAYEYQGPKCWLSDAKCSASNEVRSRMLSIMKWGWTEANEAMLDPTDCSACPFYKRTHPWAHLIWQTDFNRVFPGEGFATGRSASVLNKITPFQLRQYLIEANFTIEDWQVAYAANEPPEELLKPPYALSKEELTTINCLVRARSPA